MHFIMLMLLFMPLMIARLAKLGVLVMLGMGVVMMLLTVQRRNALGYYYRQCRAD